MTILSIVAAVLAQVFHKDLTGYVPTVAAAVSGLVAAAYQVSRGLAKRPVSAAAAVAPSVNVTAPASPAPQVTVSPVVNVPAPLPALTSGPTPSGDLTAAPLPPLDTAA